MAEIRPPKSCGQRVYRLKQIVALLELAEELIEVCGVGDLFTGIIDTDEEIQTQTVETCLDAVINTLVDEYDPELSNTGMRESERAKNQETCKENNDD